MKNHTLKRALSRSLDNTGSPEAALAVLEGKPANAVKIGKHLMACTDLKNAVAIWEGLRFVMMEQGLGSSDMPTVNACIDRRLYRISWNGRVWDAGTDAEVLP